MNRKTHVWLMMPFCGLILGLGLMIPSTESVSAAAKVGVDTKELQAVLDKAHAFLKTKQGADGSFAPKFGGPGISALVVAGLIRTGKGIDDPVVAKTLSYLEKQVRDDGGIYDKRLANYTTCVALLAFKEANKDGKYNKVIENAAKFLKTLQNEDMDANAGGVGYDGKGRPDLSNTAFFVEALIAAGVSKDDPALKKALTFVGRSQNLPGEFNDQEFAKKVTEDDKGGFVYNPSEAKSDKSPNRTPDGGLRSVGSMGYSGLKSFLYAGVGKEDARVKAAVNWIRKHYTLEENPGQKDAGLYYYYHLFAKGMDAYGEDEFADASGKKHAWRKELFEALKKRQGEDGSWINKNGAFLENLPELSTAFAILALSYCSEK